MRTLRSIAGYTLRTQNDTSRRYCKIGQTQMEKVRDHMNIMDHKRLLLRDRQSNGKKASRVGH